MMTIVYLIMKRIIETVHESRSGQNMLHLQRNQIFHDDWQNRIEKNPNPGAWGGDAVEEGCHVLHAGKHHLFIYQQYEEDYNSFKQH